MNIGEILTAVLLAVAGGAAGAAVINGINERWKFRANRKAVKEDRAEEKADKTDELTKTLSGLQEQITTMKDSAVGGFEADPARPDSLAGAELHQQGRNLF